MLLASLTDPIVEFATNVVADLKGPIQVGRDGDFISLPAGVAKMPFWRFSALTLLGCIPWVLMLTLIGKAAGDNWEDWKDSLHYVDYAVAAMIVGGVIYLIVRRRRQPAADGATDAASELT